MTKAESVTSPMAYRWGSLSGSMPGQLRAAARRGESGLNNRPLDIVHNHDIRNPKVRYEGFSKTAPDHHLFKCYAKSDPPQKPVKLIAFQLDAFVRDSKAGHGGCSMRLCPGQAVYMRPKGKQAYCEKCAHRVTGNLPCQWTSIEICRRKWGIALGPYSTDCGTCVAFEDEAA